VAEPAGPPGGGRRTGRWGQARGARQATSVNGCGRAGARSPRTWTTGPHDAREKQRSVRSEDRKSSWAVRIRFREQSRRDQGSPADHRERRLLVGGMCRLRKRLAGSLLRPGEGRVGGSAGPWRRGEVTPPA
jgi:hypothetical protein